MYERVLFPTDGSDGAREATEHAIAIAERFDAPIHALNVVDVSPTSATDAYSGVAIERLEVEGEEHVEAVAQRAAEAGVEATTEVVEGTPERTIVEVAQDGDVIVMGTAGRTGIERYLLGSTTERVVRTADVPVVTVPVHGIPAEDEER